MEPKPWMGWFPKWRWLKKWTHEEIESEIEVEVTGYFCPGEPMTNDSPGEVGFVQFEFAEVAGKPFKLWPDEIFIAEEEMLINIRDDLSFRQRWNLGI